MSDMGLPKLREFGSVADQRKLVADDDAPDNSIAKYVDGSLTRPKPPSQVGGAKTKPRTRRTEHPDVFIVAQLQAYQMAREGQESRDAAVQPPG